MVKIDKELSVRLSNLTLFATLLILLMHLPSAGVSFKLPSCIDITHLAVPLFFMISGYLVAAKADEDCWYRVLIKKRIKTLVIPYFALNTLLLPIVFVYHNVLNLGGRLSFDWDAIVRIYGLSYKYHPACGVLWYVRCLFFFMLLSWVLVKIVRRSCARGLVFCCLGLLFVSCFEATDLYKKNWTFFYSFFNVNGLLCFIVGMALTMFSIEKRSIRQIAGLCLLIIGYSLRFVLGCPCLYPSGNLLMVLSLWMLMPSVRLPKWLLSSCFVIYVFHSLVYDLWKYAMGRCEVLEWVSNVFPFAPFFVALGICCALTYVVRNHCPKVGVVLFGGRC